MATYYIDPANGSDAAAGTSWGAAWKTITSGATAARITAGDVIKIAKSPAPYSLGNAKWVSTAQSGGDVETTTKSVSATADNGAGLIRITTSTAHGYSTGDIIRIAGIVGTVEANDVWIITVIDATKFDLVGSAYVNPRTSGGSCQRVNARYIVLDTPQTKTITSCNVAWTSGGADVTPTLEAVQYTDGVYSAKFTFDASTQTNKLQAYFPTGTLDLSAYQGITFAIKNTAAIADATTLTITLCSDTAGATPVDTFIIPAIPFTSTQRWAFYTIMKSGGGNLGSSIQSIALNSGATAPANNLVLYMDNFQAVTTNGLNLLSLISKNNAEQGGAEGWYPLVSIKENLLQVGNMNAPGQSRGYCGTSETVTTYAREVFTLNAATATGYANQFVESGTAAAPIEYQAGYNTGTDLQTGETYFGSNIYSWGEGLNTATFNYIKLNRFGFARYGTGLNIVQSVFITSDYLGCFSGCTVGMSINTTSNNGLYGEIGGPLFCDSTSFNINASSNITINKICNANGTQTSSGINIQNVAKNIEIKEIVMACNNKTGGVVLNISGNPGENIRFGKVLATHNATYGLILGTLPCPVSLYNATTTGNGSGGISRGSLVVGYNCSFAETTEVNTVGTLSGTYAKFSKVDGTIGNNWIYGDDGTINSQETTRHTASGVAWKFAPGTTRLSNYPLELSVAKIAVKSGSPLTIGAWVKKDHATQVQGQLLIRGGQIAGVDSDVIATMTTSDTNWNQLNLASITPTEDGVIEVVCQAWYVSGASYVYIDDLVIT